MKKFIALLLLVLMQFIFIPVPKAHAYSNPATVPLLTATNFAALAATAVSSPLLGTVLNNGDLGINAGCTDFPAPCTTPGTKGTVIGGVIHNEDGVATTGQTDASAAVTNIGGRTADTTLLAQLGGQSLTQGVYEVPAAATNLTGDLTLNGDANSVFIFHLTSTLITDSGSRVVLGAGVQPCNVFWKVDSSATFNGTTKFVGTVLAHTSVTFPGGGATLNGRVIAQTGAITFNNTTINKSSCSADNTFNFPSCPLSTPGDKAHYTTGNHQVIGGSVLSGSDDVYSLENNNFLQCFCPAVGTGGIQTNWLRSDNPVAGFPFFVNGTQWNLGNVTYAAQNINFTCQSTPTSSNNGYNNNFNNGYNNGYNNNFNGYNNNYNNNYNNGYNNNYNNNFNNGFSSW